MSSTPTPNTHQKAFEVNMDHSRYGTVAEIGAGQEVARWLFRVGGASSTVAKTMSAYDMAFSDAIYGQSERYVSRTRLREMLNHEYGLLIERLDKERGGESCFFVYAATVAARSYSRQTDGHGWIGVRMQPKPGALPNDILLHVRLFDEENVAQQEALGELGINLLWAATFHGGDPEKILDSLMDNLSRKRIEVDIALFEGEAYERDFDNRLLNLRLVEKDLTSAVLFSPEGQVWHASEWLYKRPVLLERGRFRPVTSVNLDMLSAAGEAFAGDCEVPGEQVLEIMEITMNNLLSQGGVDQEDFLARVDILNQLGKTVMVSNYGEFYRLAGFLNHFSHAPIGFVLGVALLRELFDEKYYTSLEGGILESFGRLFKAGVCLYTYPSLDESSGEVLCAGTLPVADNLKHLHRHLLDNGLIRSLKTDTPKPSTLSSGLLADQIRAGDPYWKTRVTPFVAELIERNGYWGCQGGA